MQDLVIKRLESFNYEVSHSDLYIIKTVDPKSLEFINLETEIKQIQEGDTNITFSDSSKTQEQRLDEYINYLIRKEINLACYRRLRW